MKKYFLLFTASFLVFEICLMAGSSSSYGMDPQIEDDSQSIVLYNSQGQKARKIALYGEDPAVDNRFQRYGKAPITILLGTSTAGKTTLIHSIQMKFPTIKDYSEDLRFPIYGGNLIKNYCLTEYNILNAVVPHEEIFNVLNGNKIKSRNFLPEQLDLAKKALQKIIDEDLFEFDDETFDWALRRDREADQLIVDSMKGIPIILDHTKLWGVSQIFSRNFYADVNIMITFCPLEELPKRLERRNEEAEKLQQLTNIRKAKDPLWQFTELYKKRENHMEPLLQVLTRQDVLSIFRRYLVAGKVHNEETFLQSLGFISPEIDTVEITTRAPYYHSLLNTKTHVYTRFR